MRVSSRKESHWMQQLVIKKPLMYAYHAYMT